MTKFKCKNKFIRLRLTFAKLKQQASADALRNFSAGGQIPNTKTNVLSFVICALILVIPAIALAENLSGTSYQSKEGIVCLAGPGTSSSTYDLKNVVGANTGSMSSSLYSLLLGSQGLNRLPSATIANYNNGQPTQDETPTLQWTYSDPDNDSQKKYQLQVGHESFANPVIDTDVVSSSSTSYTTAILPPTEERTVYKWRIRVHDGFGWSGWVQSDKGFYLSEGEFLIIGLSALTAPGGQVIQESTWQKDNDPYFYWEAPAVGLEVLGYSCALDVLPDDVIDTRTTYYNVAPQNLTDGSHIFYVQAQRDSGIWGEPASFNIWVDTTGPSVNSLTPQAGAITANDQPEIALSVADAASGIDPQSIELRINQAKVSPEYNPQTGQITFKPAIPLGDGEITISLSTSDLVGNFGLPLSWSFVVDTQKPTGAILINNGDEMTTTNMVSLNISTEDEAANVKEMMLSNDGVFDTEVWEPCAMLRRNWALAAINGIRKVYVKFKDEAGNISEIFSDEINLVLIAPQTFILSGPSGITLSLDVQFTFQSSLAESQFSYKFDNEDWSEWSTSTSAIKSGLTEGNHYFLVKAAKDLNKDGLLQLDEVDPTPALRVWTISSGGLLKPPARPERPVKEWKEE